jgi:Protein of unknown function (DUF1592)/Protein of unknown function (DUF1588)/Protein of unknown function (DUF1595)/Protein of unknown function (DUF1585)/Protein of unknown function (DUF1587)
MRRAPSKLLGRALAIACALGLAACVRGQIAGGAGDEPGGGGAGNGGNAGSAGAGGAPGPVPSGSNDGWPAFGPAASFQLRRLTTEQYTATVETLLGIKASGMPPIERVTPVAGFSAIGASSAAVSSAGVGQFEDAARFLSHAAFAPATRQRLVPCTPAGPGDMACLGMFVTSFGRRAFRRPLTTEETARYTAAAAQVGAAAGDPWQGLEAITSAFLQSPHFLYLTEAGEPDPQRKGRYRLTGYEMAARLSYFLTGNTPDDELLAAAASGALLRAEDVQAQARRLLALPAARATVRAFFTTMLSLDNLDTLARPKELFPKFSPTLGAAMKEETARVIDDLVFARDGDYRHLFDQPETFVNAELASLYGVPAPTGGTFAATTLPASAHRAGLLGQAGVLAARDHADGTSPTRRGLFVLTRLLCQDLPLMPPADLQIPPPPQGLLTARQRFEQHSTNPVCASCHHQTDPVGFALERFDALGVYRETDHGLAIDDQGELGGRSYAGEAGLGAVLREHPALGPCLIQAVYGVGVGHLATEFDRDSFGAMVQQFGAGGARIRSLLAAVVASDGFRFLPALGP